MLVKRGRAKIVIGIDPGISGAIAFLGFDGELDEMTYLSVHSMPIEAKRSGRNQVNARRMRKIFDNVVDESFSEFEERKSQDVRVLIEQVSAMPGQGVSGMFSLGDSFGVARTIACEFGPVWTVSPQVWKKALGLLKQDKSASLARARKLFRGADDQLLRKKDEGRAEALLIAYYARSCLGW